MTNQWAVFESHVHLCKYQCKSTGVDELSISCISFWYWLLLSQLVLINFWYRSLLPLHFTSTIKYLYGRLQWRAEARIRTPAQHGKAWELFFFGNAFKKVVIHFPAFICQGYCKITMTNKDWKMDNYFLECGFTETISRLERELLPVYLRTKPAEETELQKINLPQPQLSLQSF